MSPDEYAADGVRMIRTSDLSADGLSAADSGVFLSTPLEESSLVRTDDILLSRAGTIGRSFLVPQEAAGSAFAGFLVRFRPRADMDARFIAYTLKAQSTQDTIHAEAVVSTIQNFNAERYANLVLPDAQPDEQRRIADFLDDRVARVDRIIAARREQAALVRA